MYSSSDYLNVVGVVQVSVLCLFYVELSVKRNMKTQFRHTHHWVINHKHHHTMLNWFMKLKDRVAVKDIGEDWQVKLQSCFSLVCLHWYTDIQIHSISCRIIHVIWWHKSHQSPVITLISPDGIYSKQVTLTLTPILKSSNNPKKWPKQYEQSSTFYSVFSVR